MTSETNHGAVGPQQLGPPEPIPIEKLLLDPENPPIAELAPQDEVLSQDQLFTILWKHMAVDELALSMAANGYFSNEELYINHLGGEY